MRHVFVEGFFGAKNAKRVARKKSPQNLWKEE
jgi:hypothetical protein